MSRYLEDRSTAPRMIQAQQAEAARDRERPVQVTSIGTAESNAHTAMLRDPEARAAHYAAEKAERDRLDGEREAARVKRAADALARRTEIVDPTARGMARYAPRTDTPS